MPVPADIPTIRQARDIGLPYYQYIVDNWGDLGAAGTEVDRAFVSDIPVRWLAMDPGSDIGALLVQYNNGFPGTTAMTNLTLGMELNNMLLMSVERPFIDKIAAQLVLRTELSGFFTDTYRTELGVTAPFGSVLSQTTQRATPSTFAGIWMQPQLRVFMGFEEPPSVSAKRYTKLYRQIRDAAGPDELLQVIPVFDRKKARVTFFIPAGADWDVRVTGVAGTVFTNIVGAQDVFLQEFSLGAPSTLTNVVGPAELTFQLSDFNANYLLIKGTKNGGTPLELIVSVTD